MTISYKLYILFTRIEFYSLEVLEVAMLPIENENYAMLYTFQPDYLAQLILDDQHPSNPPAEINQAEENRFAGMMHYILTFFKK